VKIKGGSQEMVVIVGLWLKILIMTIQVNLVQETTYSPELLLLAIDLPSQPFFGCHL